MSLIDGTLDITGSTFKIADHSTFSGVNAVFTQTGGSVNSNAPIRMGTTAGTTGAAIYDLLGGTITIEPTAPFLFNNPGDNVYFNFAYGNPTSAALILKGVWDFAGLTGIAGRRFPRPRPAGRAGTTGLRGRAGGTVGLHDRLRRARAGHLAAGRIGLRGTTLALSPQNAAIDLTNGMRDRNARPQSDRIAADHDRRGGRGRTDGRHVLRRRSQGRSTGRCAGR